MALAYKTNENTWVVWGPGSQLPHNGLWPPKNAEESYTEEELADFGLYKIAEEDTPEGKQLVSKTLVDRDGLPAYEYEYEDIPIHVPEYVTNFQARAVLMSQGLFDSVNTAILNSGNPVAIQAWEYANHVGRHGALTNALAAQLGFTDEQLDQLFIAAEQIEA